MLLSLKRLASRKSFLADGREIELSGEAVQIVAQVELRLARMSDSSLPGSTYEDLWLF